MNQLDHIATEYRESVNVIAAALTEFCGNVGSVAERRAEAIIARLAAHDPPILLEMQQDANLPYRECSHERLCQIVEEQLRRITELEKAVQP